jgi:hypothetical protein
MGAISAEAKDISERLRSQGVSPRQVRPGHRNHGQTFLRQGLTHHIGEAVEYCSIKPL